MERRFKMPLLWLSAPLGIFACVWLSFGLPALTWTRLGIWLLAGLVIYAIYGRLNSRMA